jgi:hypothetical protein
MKKYLFPLLLLLIMVIYAGCKKDDTDNTDNTGNPVAACATYTAPATIHVHDTISFHNCSENATSFGWNFGDGGTSTDQNPSHSYDHSGKFTVVLTSYGEGFSPSIPGTFGTDYDTTMLKFSIKLWVK